MAYKVFSNGNALNASELNTYLMNQAVISFATTTARDAALPSPSEGQLVWLEDSNKYVYYTGSAWADLITPASSGNAIINGAFDIWQRGTSFTPTSAAYNADRFRGYRNSSATGSTFSRVSTGTLNPQLQYAMRMQRNSGNTGTENLFLDYTLETVNSLCFASQTVTFSYYARAGANFSAASSAFTVYLVYGTGTDQNQSGFTGRAAVATSNATLTTSWQRFTVTATVPSTATQLGFEANFAPVGTAGAADYAEVTGFQLEVGSTATAFKRNASNIQGELAACQRYYFRVTAPDASNAIGPYGSQLNGTQADITFTFPTMRVPTSVEASNIGMFKVTNSTNYSGGTWALAASYPGLALIRYTHGSSVFTSGQTILPLTTASNGYLALNAEL